MSLKTPGGLPPALKAAIMASLAKQFPDMDVALHEVGAEDVTDASETEDADRCECQQKNRHHLVQVVLDHFDGFESVDQVIHAADTLYQYITTGAVPA